MPSRATGYPQRVYKSYANLTRFLRTSCYDLNRHPKFEAQPPIHPPSAQMSSQSGVRQSRERMLAKPPQSVPAKTRSCCNPCSSPNKDDILPHNTPTADNPTGLRRCTSTFRNIHTKRRRPWKLPNLELYPLASPRVYNGVLHPQDVPRDQRRP
jgi:hypothetical protein